ncbi:GlsB/YeaQ/YmgE family stress response membrane protein [Methylobacterium sp. ARG-1]|uniref:GlsB/YeaQ/YmgE family stress response membrane protein n=1 Tax=Methylobacterium sp. ARG-1 TaxID=1692501 RepID=UPI000682B2C9|nr:GlsB/YeaQ/YmgE family stress response membrane protein [Methylobacterium sp. ARG-1]KNY20107.1 transglycosylase [Methylobacterium sp. ARG-1]
MSLLAWILLGLVAGFIGSKVVNNTGQGLLVDILLGVVGAVVGGFLFNQFGEPSVSGLNFYSLVVAVVGAVNLLWLYHALIGRRVLRP